MKAQYRKSLKLFYSRVSNILHKIKQTNEFQAQKQPTLQPSLLSMCCAICSFLCADVSWFSLFLTGCLRQG